VYVYCLVPLIAQYIEVNQKNSGDSEYARISLATWRCRGFPDMIL
jgi:hypothetical protein